MAVSPRCSITRVQRPLLDLHPKPLAAVRSLMPRASLGGIARDDRALKVMRETVARGLLADRVREAERAHREARKTFRA